MKICRVFVSEYPGRTIGQILDVFDPTNGHPGSILAGTIKEVEVANDFDMEIMDGVVDENQDVTFEENAGKVAAKAAKAKEALITIAYNEMTVDVLAEMEEVFGTKLPESATAHHETWKLMISNPALFAAEGLLADKAMPGFAEGAALDTEQKCIDYATLRIAEVQTYGVNRAKRIKQFRDERAAILAG